jgi:hypothetical protein
MSPYTDIPIGSCWRIFRPALGASVIVTVMPTGDRAPSGTRMVAYDDEQGYHRTAYVAIEDFKERVHNVRPEVSR